VERNTWYADGTPAGQDISLFLWKPKVHHRVHKSPPPVHILSAWIRPTHFQNYFPEIHFNIILPSMLRSFEWFRPFRLCNQYFVCVSRFIHARYMHSPSHNPPFDDLQNILWRVQAVYLLTMQFSPVSRHFIPLGSKYSPKHPVIKTLNPCCSPNTRD
jgi:hypothetical protein